MVYQNVHSRLIEKNEQVGFIQQLDLSLFIDEKISPYVAGLDKQTGLHCA
jgi:hypothetical protein